MFRYGWKLFVLLIVAAFVFLWLIKAPIMSTYVQSKIRMPVTFRMISMWPRETSIRHFQIPNPPGYSNAALKADRINVYYNFRNLFKEPVEIDQIVLSDVYLNIVLPTDDRTVNNWSAIGERMPEGKEENTDVVVKQVVIDRLTVVIEGKGAKALGIEGTRHVDHLVIGVVDSRKGFPTEELVDQIFKGAGFEIFIKRFLNPDNTIKKAIKPLNRIFGKEKSPVSQGP